MDVSGSMCSGDIAPNRLLAAEAAASAFIERAGRRHADRDRRVQRASPRSSRRRPPTARSCSTALHSLTTGRRTAIGSGILAAIDAIAEVDPSVAPRAITDGRPGTEPAAARARAPTRRTSSCCSPTAPATPVRSPPTPPSRRPIAGVRVYTIGFGTADGGAFNGSAPASSSAASRAAGSAAVVRGGGGGGGGGGGFRRGIDETTLKEVADITGGTYYPAESADQLQEVFAGLPTNLVFRHEVAEISVVFVGLALAAAAAASLFGRLWRPLP